MKNPASPISIQACKNLRCSDKQNSHVHVCVYERDTWTHFNAAHGHLNEDLNTFCLGNIYTMGCPPVRGDNPRALASGLYYVQVGKHGITFYTTYISRDLAHHEIFCTKVGKGGIKPFNMDLLKCIWIMFVFT